jgi:hypothetical protein
MFTDRPHRLGIACGLALATRRDGDQKARYRARLARPYRQDDIRVSLDGQRGRAEHRLRTGSDRRFHAIVDRTGRRGEYVAERIDREGIGRRQLAHQRTRRLGLHLLSTPDQAPDLCLAIRRRHRALP